MSAILELKETPQSCGECQLRGYNEALDYDDHEGYAGAICHGEKSLYMEVSDYLNTNTRHPDCPLKITEDNLRWQGNGTETIGYYITCPDCKKEPHGNWDREGFSDDDFPKYCPHCSIKLLPPEEV